MSYAAGDILTAADLNRPIFHAVQTVGQSIANASNVAITFSTEAVDSHNGHSTVSNTSRYVAQVAGWYLVSGGVSWPSNATGQRAMSFMVNGTTLVAGSQNSFSAVAALRQLPARTVLVHLAVNDYVEMIAFQDSGGSLTTDVSFAQLQSSLTVVLMMKD